MDNYWTLETRGDPLRTVQDFVRQVWEAAGLEKMLVTTNGGGEARPRLIDDPEQLAHVNPFKPLMLTNAARLVPGMLKDNPTARLGAVLRPCEMRALIEMAKHSPLPLEQLLTITVDCLGTLPADEYLWRAERKGTPDGLAQEALKFARQGGIVPYRYRSACQVCDSPYAQAADLNIHVLGLPVRQVILVNARDAALAERTRLPSNTQGPAAEDMVEQHERVLAKISERHQLTMERVAISLGSLLPANLEAVVQQLEGCGSCSACVNNCPICSVDKPERDAEGKYADEDIRRWLISCAGCGMCDQSCPSHLPLWAIFGHIRQQLNELWGYVPGRSLEETLPV